MIVFGPFKGRESEGTSFATCLIKGERGEKKGKVTRFVASACWGANALLSRLRRERKGERREKGDDSDRRQRVRPPTEKGGERRVPGSGLVCPTSPQQSGKRKKRRVCFFISSFHLSGKKNRFYPTALHHPSQRGKKRKRFLRPILLDHGEGRESSCFTFISAGKGEIGRCYSRLGDCPDHRRGEGGKGTHVS